MTTSSFSIEGKKIIMDVQMDQVSFVLDALWKEVTLPKYILSVYRFERTYLLKVGQGRLIIE